MKTRLSVLFLLLIAACAPLPRTNDSLAKANAEFDGNEVDNFFLDYGAPTSMKTARNGDKIYRWVSIDPNGGGGGGGYINYPNGNYVIPPSSDNGEMVTGYCEISIRTNSHDIVQKITLVNDSIGKFSGSRCAELFSISNK